MLVKRLIRHYRHLKELIPVSWEYIFGVRRALKCIFVCMNDY